MIGLKSNYFGCCKMQHYNEIQYMTQVCFYVTIRWRNMYELCCLTYRETVDGLQDLGGQNSHQQPPIWSVVNTFFYIKYVVRGSKNQNESII